VVTAAAKGDKRGANILGKATNTKAGSDVSSQGGADKSIQMDISEEQKFKDAQLTQDEGQDAQEGSFDDMMLASTPKEAAAIAQNKGPGQFATTLNQFSVDSTTRLNSTTATLNTSGTEKAPSQLTETLNINRPDLSVNMKERLNIMMNKGIQTADIRLDPADLGQMQVKMAVENDVTSVSFVVQNSQAKELLELMMPKLREMLAEQGVEMGEGSVSQQQQEQQELGDEQNQQDGQLASNNAQDDEQIDPASGQEIKITNGALGGIDFFA
jgi:flagellar hook-length control protein FliK